MIPITVLARLPSMLRSAGAAGLTRAREALAKVGITVSSVDDIMVYARQSPANAALVFTNLAMAGFAVSDLFTGSDKQDRDVRALVADLAMAELGQVNTRIEATAAASESLAGIVGDRKDLAALAEILRFAVGHYGSHAAAINAHSRHQAFFELSKNDVEAGLRLLNLS